MFMTFRFTFIKVSSLSCMRNALGKESGILFLYALIRHMMSFGYNCNQFRKTMGINDGTKFVYSQYHLQQTN